MVVERKIQAASLDFLRIDNILRLVQAGQAGRHELLFFSLTFCFSGGGGYVFLLLAGRTAYICSGHWNREAGTVQYGC